MELSSLKSIRDVAKVRKKVPSGKPTVRFSGVEVSATGRVRGAWLLPTMDGPMDGLPLMVLWNSCGKMPLGASWWSTQRRNCLATPAALPGTIMLELNGEGKDRESWNRPHERRDLFRVQAFTHRSSYGIPRCPFHR